MKPDRSVEGFEGEDDEFHPAACDAAHFASLETLKGYLAAYDAKPHTNGVFDNASFSNAYPAKA